MGVAQRGDTLDAYLQTTRTGHGGCRYRRGRLEPAGQAMRFGILQGRGHGVRRRTHLRDREIRPPSIEERESGPVAYGGFPSIPWPAPGTEIHGEGEGRAAHASPGRSGRWALLFMDSPARSERVRRER